jgi:hypothetical protein
MTQAARSNLQLRRPPTATTASSRTTPLRSRGAPIGWPCWSPATPPARPSTSRPTTGHAARCCSCPAPGREVRRHPLCRVLPHQRVLKRTYPDCRFGRSATLRPAGVDLGRRRSVVLGIRASACVLPRGLVRSAPRRRALHHARRRQWAQADPPDDVGRRRHSGISRHLSVGQVTGLRTSRASRGLTASGISSTARSSGAR